MSEVLKFNHQTLIRQSPGASCLCLEAFGLRPQPTPERLPRARALGEWDPLPLPRLGTPAVSRSLGHKQCPEAEQGLCPALGCLLFVSEAPPCLLAKETQEILAGNAVPGCPAEMTTSWRAREEGGEK